MSHYKVYINEEYFTPSWYPYHAGDYSRYKAGYVGKSHSEVRYDYWRRDASAGKGQLGTTQSGYFYKVNIDQFAFPLNIQTLQHNRLLAKLEGQLGPAGSLGASIFAEGTESVKMAVNMLDRAANLVKGFKRKDIRRLKKAWDKPMRPTTAMKKAGGGWLEFSFGWKPLVDTVCQAIAVTGGDFPPVKVVARDRMYNDLRGTPGSYRGYWWTHATQFVKYGFSVKVVNPNVWLLGRLDLINPGGWIWEAIPYSFFVDYFVNINEMIHNLDSFAGLQLFNGYSTYYHSWTDQRVYLDVPNWDYNSEGYVLNRTVPPSLNRRFALQQNPLTSSWQRGLNSSSFLAQRLR